MSQPPDRVARPLIRAIAANTTLALNLHSRATGLTPNVVHDNRWIDRVRTAYDFLVSSRLTRGDAEMGLSFVGYAGQDAAELLQRVDDSDIPGQFHALPPSAPMAMTLAEVFRRRRSVRDYDGGSVPLRSLASILRSAAGIASLDHGGPAMRRKAPSGGALYPIALQLCAIRVEDLERGVYLIDTRRDGLWSNGDQTVLNAVLGALAMPDHVIAHEQAAAVCLLIARPARSIRKYGVKAVRNILLEAGAMAEHLALAATALGIASVHCASFYDDEVHEALGLDGVHELLVHSVFLGIRSDG